MPSLTLSPGQTSTVSLRPRSVASRPWSSILSAASWSGLVSRARTSKAKPCRCMASGTSNMKFIMNGALTIGTRDGARIEMAEEAGEENFFLFGLTADQVESSRGWYNPHWHYDSEPETRAALDLIFADYFSRYEPGIFAPLRDALLTHGDHYMHLADLTSYVQTQERLGALYRDPGAWAQKAILNVASSGKFSSDRTIHEYATEIWKPEPCPIP